MGYTLKPSLNNQEQTRRTVLAARVPKIPLYFLIGLNVVYAIFGCILAAIAVSSLPRETNDVRERLSYAGLVAYCFEGARAKGAVDKKREMFAEHDGRGGGRIAIEKSGYGGFEFTNRKEMLDKQIGADHDVLR
jgi:hypothetical protein